MVDTTILARAIGRSLAGFDHLTGAYLPPDIAEDDARAIAVAADEQRGNPDPPYAILVQQRPEPSSDGATVVSPDRAIAYREGHRLAVFHGNTAGLMSLEKAYKPRLTRSFPIEEPGTISLDSIAGAALDECLIAAGRAGASRQVTPEMIDRLADVLRTLRDLHSGAGSTGSSWNSHWMRHVEHGLAVLADQVERSDPAARLGDVIKRFTYAAFSLPTPRSGTFQARSLSRKLADAFTEWWSDAESVSTTVALLANHPDTPAPAERHALAELDWSELDRTITTVDSALVGFAAHERSASGRVAAFADLTESQFLQPVHLEAARRLQLLDEHGSVLAPLTGTELHLLTSRTIEDDGVPHVESLPLLVRTSTLGAVPQDSSAEDIRLHVSVRSGTFHDPALIHGQDALFVSGTIRLRMRPGPFKYEARARDISLTRATGSLEGLVDPNASARFLLLPPTPTGALLFPTRPKGKLGPPIVVAPRGFGEDGQPIEEEDWKSVGLRSGESFHVLAWQTGEPQAPSLNGTPLVPLESSEVLYSLPENFQPSGNDILLIGGTEIELILESSHDTRPLSPLLAAALDEAVSNEQVPEDLQESLLGTLETEMARLLTGDAAEWRGSLGHMALAEDLAGPIGPLVAHDGGSTLASPRLAARWQGLGNMHVPEALTASSEAERLREAFDALEVPSRLKFEDADASFVAWPSRVSWAHLWEDDAKLREYLAAYTSLLHKAAAIGDPRGVLWAAYPFSAIIRVTDPPPARCQAVLLSPLHPIRLTWLAAAESLLRAGRQSRRLAGVVEGWNLPAIGPSDSAAGRLLAIPIDNGTEQLFLGWAMMIRAQVDGPGQLVGPRSVNGKPAPGSASSGLNAAGVTSAIRDYRRLNPHVTTLTVDLAASTPAQRLVEVDRAVLREAHAWTHETADALSGGFRVVDSLHRLGSPPREELAAHTGVTPSAPLTWSRYKQQPGAAGGARPANLRILQDSGLAVQVTSGDGPSSGTMGRLPLRRFAVPSGLLGPSATATAEPTLVDGVGWPPLAQAIQAVECGPFGTAPVIETQLVGGALGRADAEWTISGEAMVNPASLARLLRETGQASTMLWEWRPPFLASKEASGNEPLLEQRPYMSIAKVPRSFKTQLASRIDALGRNVDSDSAAERMLATLGERGIGLSSLLAMGDSQATGALGFGLTMQLLDAYRGSQTDTLIMPIDLCQSFLGALAPEHSAGESDLRRADLLVLDLHDDRLTLIAIEIKMYGLQTPVPTLPAPNSSATQAALEQLGSTQRLLTSITSTYRQSPEADRTLMAHALATLVETGIRLAPGGVVNRSRTLARLTSLAEGRSDVACGSPVLAFFQNGGKTASGDYHASYRHAVDDQWPQGHAEFIANPARVLDELEGEADGPATENWAELLRWAAREITDTAGTDVPVRTATEGTDGPASQTSSSITDVPITPAPAAEVSSSDPAPPPSSDSRTFDDQTIDDEPRFDGEQQGIAAAPDPAPYGSEPQQTGVRFPVGTLMDSLDQTALADYWPGNTNLNQLNVGVVGDLGTGKTQLLKSLIFQLRTTAREQQQSPISLLVLDYKKDFQDPEFLDAVGGRVLEPRRIPLNVLGLTGEVTQQAAYQKAKSFVDTLSKIYSGIGPVQRNRLLESLLSLYSSTPSPSLDDLRTAYLEDANHKSDAPVSVLNEFVLGEVFSDGADHLPFDELLHDSVLVVDLHGLGADQNLKNALVALFLNLYYEYMQGLRKWPYVDQPDGTQIRRLNSFLLVDEAVNIMRYRFDVLQQLLLQGREFGVGVMLSSQYLSHFNVSGTNYGEALRTWFIHKVPNVTLKELSQLGLPDASESDANAIKQLGVHEAYYSSLDYAGRFIRGIPYYQLRPSVE